MLRKASTAAYLITQKVGVSIDAQEGCIHCAMYVALQHRCLLATEYRQLKSLTLGFSIEHNRFCYLFPGTELFTIALALYISVASVAIQ